MIGYKWLIKFAADDTSQQIGLVEAEASMTKAKANLVFSWQDGGRLEKEKVRLNTQKAMLEDGKIEIPDDAVGFEQDGIYLE